MSTYVFDDKIKFELPSGFFVEKEQGDDGNEFLKISAGAFKNRNGETDYKFRCQACYAKYEVKDNNITSKNVIDYVADTLSKVGQTKFSGTPKTILVNQVTSKSIFGLAMHIYVSVGLVQVESWDILRLTFAGMLDDDPQVNSERNEFYLQFLRSIRVKGRKLPLENYQLGNLNRALSACSENDAESIDFTSGGEGKASFTRAVPDEELYPHYKSVLSLTAGPAAWGLTVAVNTAGTQYAFLPLRDIAENAANDSNIRKLFRRIVDKDTKPYKIYEKAIEMKELFRVNPSAFDPTCDRECEIEKGMLKRAYMLSGLRSFTWTLADYCQKYNCTPETIDNRIPSQIVDFVAGTNWLNYDGNTHCCGLCSGSDFNVYFLPDGVTKADKQELLPSEEEREKVRQIKKNFPQFTGSLNEAHSLDELRKDLEYVYPAVRILWEKLAENRNRDKPLDGDEADVVYAWCTLALAAREPFFSQEGPDECNFEQSTTTRKTIESPQRKESSQTEKTTENLPKERITAHEWMKQYGEYIEYDPMILFVGSIFVFSGLTGRMAEKDHPVVKQVLEKGGQYRTRVSGVTDYLVVNPDGAGRSKVLAAIEEKEKGKPIKIVRLEDLEKVLKKAPPFKAEEGEKIVSGQSIVMQKTAANRSNFQIEEARENEPTERTIPQSEQTYQKALQTMNRAISRGDYRDAAQLFRSISGYRDSDKRYQDCVSGIERLRKDQIYADGVKQMREGTYFGYRGASWCFKEIPGWRDADTLLKQCLWEMDWLKK